MRSNDVTAERLRELADRSGAGGKVLSLFMDLTPSEFATPAARASAIGSLVNEARRCVEDADLDHDERARLRAEVDRLADELHPDTLPARGAAGLAIYGTPEGFEILRLPSPVRTHVVLADAPHVEPLADAARFEPGWCVVLVSRGTARFLFGPAEALIEEQVHSQEEWEREMPSEVEAHLRRVAEAIRRTHREGRWRHLLIGAPHELLATFEELLPDDLRRRVAGRFDADAENISVDDVIRHAGEASRGLTQRRDRELLARFEQGIGRSDGRAVAGLEATLDALEQRRVEALLIAAGADDDALDEAVRAAIRQDALVVHVGEPERTPLGPHRVGAVLRF